MTLLEEFEQNVEVVVKRLEKCAEIIKQQFIRPDVTTGLQHLVITGLQKNAAKTVGRAINSLLKAGSFTESPVKEFRQILKLLPQFVPTANPSEIEKQYKDIVKNPLRIIQMTDGLTLLNELLDKIEKLAEDLRYYPKIAREKLGAEEPAEPGHIPSKMLGDTITIKGLPINWRVICDKLKKQLFRLRAFLHKEK